ncbi:MAG TPA: MobA/MobL family protein [Steroidobacteraceae bacterium]|jgi:ATP-dependent exoDNAse (exonuclease V) alpha subunit|nr:MobA/MobL family protein [Steroidobacteraceae bacterium]
MAIYFLNIKTVGRSSGSSAVSAAAYRSGERIRDERTGRTYDHRDRQDVLHKEIMVPERFASDDMSWAKDRSNLWNLAEGSETRRNARVAREYLVVLPAELSPEARIRLASGFSRELVERYRFALDMAVHAPRDYPGSDPRNFHAHLLATTREVTVNGLGSKTELERNDTVRRQMGLGPEISELLQVRERWALAANAALEQSHIAARIDHRTLEAQGVDREPGPHIPRIAYEMERHGYRSVVAERIRAEHRARVEARLAADHPKSIEDPRLRSAMNWKRYREEQEQLEIRRKRDQQLEPSVDDGKPSRKRGLDHSL